MKRRLEEEEPEVSQSHIQQLFESKTARTLEDIRIENEITKKLSDLPIIYLCKKKNLRRFLSVNQRKQALRIANGFDENRSVLKVHPEIMKRDLKLTMKLTPSKLSDSDRVIVRASNNFDLSDISIMECLNKPTPFTRDEIGTDFFTFHGLGVKEVHTDLPFRTLLKSNLHTMCVRQLALESKDMEERSVLMKSEEYTRLPDTPDTTGKTSGGFSVIDAQHSGPARGTFVPARRFNKDQCKALYGYTKESLMQGIYSFMYMPPNAVKSVDYCMLPANHAIVIYIWANKPNQRGIIFKPDGKDHDTETPLFAFVPRDVVLDTIDLMTPLRNTLPLCETKRVNFELVRLNADSPDGHETKWSTLKNTIRGTTEEDMQKEYTVEITLDMCYTCFRKDTGDAIVTLPASLSANFSNEEKVKEHVEQTVLEDKKEKKPVLSLQQLRLMDE